MPSSGSAEEKLENLEIALLQPDFRKSVRVSQLLADDFVEFGASGRKFNKAQIIASLKDEPASERSVSDLRVQLLTEDVALVTYQVHRSGQPTSLRSSLWQQRKGRWQMVFHQGTQCAFRG